MVELKCYAYLDWEEVVDNLISVTEETTREKEVKRRRLDLKCLARPRRCRQKAVTNMGLRHRLPPPRQQP